MNKPLCSGHAKYSLHDILLMWANGLIVLALGVLCIQEMKNIFFLIGALALATKVDACFRGYSDSDCQSCFIILSTSYTSKFHYTNSDTRSVPSKTIFNVVEVI